MENWSLIEMSNSHQASWKRVRDQTRKKERKIRIFLFAIDKGEANDVEHDYVVYCFIMVDDTLSPNSCITEEKKK